MVYQSINNIMRPGGGMKIFKRIVLLCIFFSFSGLTFAQNESNPEDTQTKAESSLPESPDAQATGETHSKQSTMEKAGNKMSQMPGKVYVRPDGKIFVKSKTPLYLRLATSDTDNGESYLLRNEASSDVSKPVKPFYLEGHGQHTLVHPDEHKKVYNRKGHMFHIEDDGHAPKYKVEVTKAPKAVTGKTTVYGKPVKITLEFNDEDSGLHSSYYALNAEPMSSYITPLNLVAEGDYILKFYAMDNVSNKTKTVVRYYALDFTPPTTRHITEGYHYANILSPAAVIKLRSRDTKAGVAKVLYRFKGKRGTYGDKPLNMKGLKDGEHQLVYAAVDRVKNAESNKVFDFYLDTIPPVVKSELLGDQYKKGKTTFVSGRTLVDLTATDNKAGVRRIRYYMNGRKSGRVYRDTFGFPRKNGVATVSYHASDRVINIGNKIQKKVTVDISAPSIRPHFKGEHYYRRQINYVRSSTKISFITSDNLSGVKSVQYQLDGAGEIEDRKPFSIRQPGMHEVSYDAIDNVNNRSINKTMSVFVDEQAPEIFNHFSVAQNEPGKEIYPLRAKLYLAATDKQSGIRSISYQINGKKWEKYYSAIKFINAGRYTVKIKAVDNVGNISIQTDKFIITKN